MRFLREFSIDQIKKHIFFLPSYMTARSIICEKKCTIELYCYNDIAMIIIDSYRSVRMTQK